MNHIKSIALAVALCWIIALLGTTRQDALDRDMMRIHYMRLSLDNDRLPRSLCFEFHRWQDLANDHDPVKGITERCE